MSRMDEISLAILNDKTKVEPQPNTEVTWSDLLASKDTTFLAKDIIEETASMAGISWEAILGKSTKPAFAWPRRVAMWRLHRELNMSMTSIGQLMGRDHSTVSVGVQAVQRTYEKLRRELLDSQIQEPSKTKDV